MGKYSVVEGDVTEVSPRLSKNTFDGCLTDPPYGLNFMGKDWDDGVPGESCWSEIRRILKPGAYLAAFGGTQTWHRLAVAIEDAGFEIIDTIMWIYGEGMPKGYRMTRAMDGEQWEGYHSRLKGSWEPIILAMHPREGTYADNAEEYGIGGLNCDPCRVGTQGGTTAVNHQDANENFMGGKKGRKNDVKEIDDGRFPPNLLLSHRPECDEDGCHEGCPVRRVGESSGDLGKSEGVETTSSGNDIYGNLSFRDRKIGYGDEGTAARFFPHFNYCPKASTSEREAGLGGNGRQNDHPTVKPIDLCEWLATLIRPPVREFNRRIYVPFAGTGSEMIGSIRAGWESVVGAEKENDYCEIAQKRLAHWTDKNG